MRIKVRESSGRGQKGWGRWLRRRAGELLDLLGMPEAELSLLVAGDRLMRRLNRTWRGRARTTDVLAFGQRPRAAHSHIGSYRLGEDQRGELLGDVVVCLPQAGRQARVLGHPLEKELLVLLVHGVLHLLGHEHEGVGKTRAGRMWREQERLVRLLGGG